MAKDILIITAFVGVAYLVSRNYRRKKLRERQAREFIHFQIF